jgi:hypothetical protein
MLNISGLNKTRILDSFTIHRKYKIRLKKEILMNFEKKAEIQKKILVLLNPENFTFLYHKFGFILRISLVFGKYNLLFHPLYFKRLLVDNYLIRNKIKDERSSYIPNSWRFSNRDLNTVYLRDSNLIFFLLQKKEKWEFIKR